MERQFSWKGALVRTAMSEVLQVPEANVVAVDCRTLHDPDTTKHCRATSARTRRSYAAAAVMPHAQTSSSKPSAHIETVRRAAKAGLQQGAQRREPPDPHVNRGRQQWCAVRLCLLCRCGKHRSVPMALALYQGMCADREFGVIYFPGFLTNLSRHASCTPGLELCSACSMIGKDFKSEDWCGQFGKPMFGVAKADASLRGLRARGLR